jgi:hypothetical protein
MEKDNYETRAIDTTDPNKPAPFEGCNVEIVVPPSVRTGTMTAFSEPELERLRTYLLGGGNLLLAIGPETDAPAPGLSRVLDPFGIALEQSWVLEADPHFAFPDTRLSTFTVSVKPHPVTGALAQNPDSARAPPKIVMEMARPLRHTWSGSDKMGGAASDLLATSDQSFSIGFARAASIMRGEEPEKKPGDASGPFTIAMASERAAQNGRARVVVIGSASAFSAVHWHQAAPWRGTAVLVENAIAWLASKPQVLDIPPRPSVAACMRISDESRSEVRRYVLLYMPLTFAILGIVVGVSRRREKKNAT